MPSLPLRYLLALLLAPFAGYAQPQAPASKVLSVTTLAGHGNQAGATDGVGAAARFHRPMGIAVAADGTLYVADTHNHTLRRITPAGEVSTLAGLAGTPGSQDGTGSAARFTHPIGVALDEQGALYVTDAGNHTIRRVTPDGVVITLAGQGGQPGHADGRGHTARFHSPHGIAVRADGVLLVSDTENHTIRQLTADGTVTTVAGAVGRKGAVDGMRGEARFFHPSGLAVDGTGTLYIADNGNHTLRRLAPTGQVSTLAGRAGRSGSADGQGGGARFDWPNGVAVDGQGLLYVADNVNSTVRCITPTGEVTTVAGRAHGWSSEDGKGPEAGFAFPFGVAVDAQRGILYVTDTRNQLIRALR